jgi:hypothetical protein
VTAVHVLIEGRVQGVGFRAWVEREAKARQAGCAIAVAGRSKRCFPARTFSVQHGRARHRGPRLSLVKVSRRPSILMKMDGIRCLANHAGEDFALHVSPGLRRPALLTPILI